MLALSSLMYALFLTPSGLKVTISPIPIENRMPAIVKMVDEKKPSGRTFETELARMASSNKMQKLITIFIIF
ncbi:hypothetical protein [Candidatus Williamhamiltonella defendens]|uniref:hypothetical protein n=1 Tax=Candidatus Williamhamiltonella defendens TaxID=138072 RepID=UPI0012FEBD62|nr:hypothetical protein [Candidatus Hamiltonella defensa]